MPDKRTTRASRAVEERGDAQDQRNNDATTRDSSTTKPTTHSDRPKSPVYAPRKKHKGWVWVDRETGDVLPEAPTGWEDNDACIVTSDMFKFHGLMYFPAETAAPSIPTLTGHENKQPTTGSSLRVLGNGGGGDRREDDTGISEADLAAITAAQAIIPRKSPAPRRNVVPFTDPDDHLDDQLSGNADAINSGSGSVVDYSRSHDIASSRNSRWLQPTVTDHLPGIYAGETNAEYFARIAEEEAQEASMTTLSGRSHRHRPRDVIHEPAPYRPHSGSEAKVAASGKARVANESHNDHETRSRLIRTDIASYQRHEAEAHTDSDIVVGRRLSKHGFTGYDRAESLANNVDAMPHARYGILVVGHRQQQSPLDNTRAQPRIYSPNVFDQESVDNEVQGSNDSQSNQHQSFIGPSKYKIDEESSKIPPRGLGFATRVLKDGEYRYTSLSSSALPRAIGMVSRYGTKSQARITTPHFMHLQLSRFGIPFNSRYPLSLEDQDLNSFKDKLVKESNNDKPSGKRKRSAVSEGRRGNDKTPMQPSAPLEAIDSGHDGDFHESTLPTHSNTYHQSAIPIDPMLLAADQPGVASHVTGLDASVSMAQNRGRWVHPNSVRVAAPPSFDQTLPSTDRIGPVTSRNMQLYDEGLHGGQQAYEALNEEQLE